MMKETKKSKNEATTAPKNASRILLRILIYVSAFLVSGIITAASFMFFLSVMTASLSIDVTSSSVSEISFYRSFAMLIAGFGGCVTVLLMKTSWNIAVSSLTKHFIDSKETI